MEGRLFLPVPQIQVRHGRPRIPGRPGADQPAGAAAPLRERRDDHHRRRPVVHRQGGRVTMAANDNDKQSAPNDPVTGVLSVLTTWFNDRTPGLMPVYRKHMTEYFAPKNFNF